MKTLYLIRHGTVRNPDSVVYRRLAGFHLSDQGRLEAVETREFLSGERIEVIWHSPLERAFQTAEIVNARHNVPMVEDARIHEWDEGEDSDEVMDRMQGFLRSWMDSDYAVSAAVSHRDPIRRLLFSLGNADSTVDMEDLSQFPLPQAGVYCIREDDGVITTKLSFIPSSHAQP